jgi:quaternary ammonium compound-resistance protein SugE
MGIAYAVWTGIGIVGTFLVGVVWFNESNSFASYCGIILILSGVVVLKFSNISVN